MDASRSFVPGFLKRLDKKLLSDNPVVWSARTHLVAFFALITIAGLAALCALIYKNALRDSDIPLLTGFLVIICIVGFVLWMIWLLRFNVFKRFGQWKAGSGSITFFLYFVNLVLILAIPFIPWATECFMANRQFTTQELVDDVNEINLNVARLEYAGLPKSFTADTVEVGKDIFIVKSSGDTVWAVYPNKPNEDYVDYTSADVRPRFRRIGRRELASEIAAKDSIVKVHDSLYYFLTAPDYQFVNVYDFPPSADRRILGNKNIYDRAIKNYQQPDAARLRARMNFLKQKYPDLNSGYNYGYYNDYQTSGSANDVYKRIQKKYSLSEIRSAVSTVATKKYRFINQLDFIFRFIYYFALSLSLLVFIFRHSTVKTFFISVLAAIVIAILTGLILLSLSGEFVSFFSIMLIYFVAFGIFGFLSLNQQRRSIVNGIGLNYFTFLLPMVPLLALSLYSAARYDSNDFDGLKDWSRWVLWAEIGGFVLTLVCASPISEKLYRAWYASPEE